MPTVEKVTEGCVLGEGPFWDIASQTLYFVDIWGQKLLKYTPSTKKFSKAAVEKQPSFIIPIEGKENEFIVSLGNEIVIISWDGEDDNIKIIEKVCEVDAPKTFNDGRCDSSGRLWTGDYNIAKDFAQTPPVGALYSLDATKQLKTHITKVRCPNGIAFNYKTKKMFYIDSLEGRIDQFDFDITTGTVSNRQPWFTLKQHDIQGGPDGMTIDSDGNLWVAIFTGGRVVKIDGSKSETLLDTITMPVKDVSAVVFGGPNLDELFVTSANLSWGNEPNPDVTGATYRVTGLGVRGLPAAKFKLN